MEGRGGKRKREIEKETQILTCVSNFNIQKGLKKRHSVKQRVKDVCFMSVGGRFVGATTHARHCSAPS